MALSSAKVSAGKTDGAAAPSTPGALQEWWQEAAPRIGWGILSVGMFALIWEFLWLIGVTDPKLLLPPHIFMGDIAGQAKFFNTAQRWQIGIDAAAGPSPGMAVAITILASTMRVITGLALAAIFSIAIGIAIRYWRLMENLTLPTITLLAPVSPIAWLPVAIFIFGPVHARRSSWCSSRCSSP
jgi:NitT/TauT family transport system permease protein